MIPKKILNWTLDLIFPRTCLGCKKDGAYLCSDCLLGVPIKTGVNCHICGKRLPSPEDICKNCRRKTNLDGIFSASSWDNSLLKEAVHNFKYNFIQELSSPLSEIYIRFLEINFSDFFAKKDIVLIPVPLHKKRYAWRGFNQSELLAQKIAKELEVPCRSDILFRTVNTLPQVGFSDPSDRKYNLRDAFQKIESISNLFPKNSTLILIDDVSTTGSTLEECAKILTQFKPKKVYGFVLARG